MEFPDPKVWASLSDHERRVLAARLLLDAAERESVGVEGVSQRVRTALSYLGQAFDLRIDRTKNIKVHAGAW